MVGAIPTPTSRAKSKHENPNTKGAPLLEAPIVEHLALTYRINVVGGGLSAELTLAARNSTTRPAHGFAGFDCVGDGIKQRRRKECQPIQQ